MAGRSKIRDEQEVRRWFAEGKTYREMVEIYREKYNEETTIGMWGNYRRRMGIDRRYVYDDTLVPWAIDERHRYSNALMMLRKEGRRRAGFDLSPDDERELTSWLRGLADDGAVIHYDPDTEQGFFRVHPRPGIDTDLIRVPDRVTSKLKQHLDE